MNRKILVFTGILSVICVIALYLALLSQFVGTLPPLKEYKRYENVNDLNYKILSLLKGNEKYTYSYEDTITDDNNYKGYIMNISIKDRDTLYKFRFKYYTYSSLFQSQYKSKIELHKAFNSTNWQGGFRIDDIEVKNIIKIFDEQFIELLN